MNKKVLVSFILLSLIFATFFVSAAIPPTSVGLYSEGSVVTSSDGSQWQVENGDFTLYKSAPSYLSSSTSSSIATNSKAALNDISNVIDDFSNVVNPVIKYVLGDISGDDTGDLFLVKLLVFILILAIIYFATKRVPGIKESSAVVWIVSIIVSILGVRLLTTKALVNLIWLPTGSLAIALLALVIFIIFFLFVESFDSGVIRKVGWVIFLVLFLALAISRWGELAGQGGQWWNNFAWWYIIIVIISLILILFDKKIRTIYTLNSLKMKASKRNILMAQPLFDEMDRWEKVRISSHTSPEDKKQAVKRINELRKEIAQLKAE